jgi:hypothetical protein
MWVRLFAIWGVCGRVLVPEKKVAGGLILADGNRCVDTAMIELVAAPHALRG